MMVDSSSDNSEEERKKRRDETGNRAGFIKLETRNDYGAGRVALSRTQCIQLVVSPPDAVPLPPSHGLRTSTTKYVLHTPANLASPRYY